MYERRDGRGYSDIRKVNIITGYLKDAEGSCLIETGETRVICAATVEERVPFFLKDKHQGWITAEYGMLPRAGIERNSRQRTSGRIYEIQRLIGRSFRSIANLEVIDRFTITIDCDVIQADGGTRTASITGGYIALWDAVQYMLSARMIEKTPLNNYVAAVSCGIIDGTPILDLTYDEDACAETDMNFVMTVRDQDNTGDIIEIQGTGELRPFTKQEFEKLFELARGGINKLIKCQKKALGLT